MGTRKPAFMSHVFRLALLELQQAVALGCKPRFIAWRLRRLVLGESQRAPKEFWSRRACQCYRPAHEPPLKRLCAVLVWFVRHTTNNHPSKVGALSGVMVSKPDKQTLTSEFESYWVPHSSSLVPHLSKKLSKLRPAWQDWLLMALS